MRALGLLVAFAAAMFAGVAHAAAIPLSLPSTVSQVGSTFVARPGVAFAGAAFNSGLTTQVAGKLITVPAAWRMASNAASVAVAAVRGNPALFAASLIAAWLIDYGISYIDGQAVVQQDTSSLVDGTAVCSQQGAVMTLAQCHGLVAPQWEPYGYAFDSYLVEGGITYIRYRNSSTGALVKGAGTWSGTGTCPANTTRNGSYCVGSVAVPAGESDWARVNSLPDAVASHLVDKGVGIPLNPQVDPSTQVVPLSDPYIDPVTGKRWQDVAHITPSPTDPKKADLQVSKQEVDPNGDPVVDPETNQPVAPQEQDDECLKFPNRVGCMEAGEPPEVELEEDEKEVKIEAQGGFGPSSGTCPVGESLAVFGQTFTLSWQPMCNLAQAVRPVLLALAWLSAILIALGIYKRAGA